MLYSLSYKHLFIKHTLFYHNIPVVATTKFNSYDSDFKNGSFFYSEWLSGIFPAEYRSAGKILKALSVETDSLSRKIYISLHPNNAFKSSAHTRFPEQIHFVNTQIKRQIITVNCHHINFFICNFISDRI